VAKVETRAAGASEESSWPLASSSKIVFVGFMAAGKSIAARRAARRLGTEAVDTDAVLESELGEPIGDFFDRAGEPAFREREEAVVLRLLEQEVERGKAQGKAQGRAGVLALGGGAVESRPVREELRRHLCVYVEVDPALAWTRSEGSKRPLARDRERFFDLHARRKPLYESVARAVLRSTEEALPEEAREKALERTLDAALEAAMRLHEPGVAPSVRMLWAETTRGGYPVYAGQGALDVAGSLWPSGPRPFVVADARVEELHGSRLAAALGAAAPSGASVTVPPGEQHKTLAEAERVLRALARAGMERSDAILAFGGGVVGDLAGLCAALYQRGVEFVQVPTTVVAQVDAAYGGKTAVDLPEAKNYAGAFHQPAAVLTDPSLLSTLAEREVRAGFAEVLKTALIAGGQLWSNVRELPPFTDVVAHRPELLADLIESCIRTKLAVVAEDERDVGVRATLNLGHTFAHALEAATGYTELLHGEAVAVGLLVALRMSERAVGLDPQVRREIAEILARNGLSGTFIGPSTDEILASAALDKKRRGGRQNLVLLRAPGDVAIGCEVTTEVFRDAIGEVRCGEGAR
jgi:shikimate kinase/3-dehydroquinate synthase